jgi:hypothetical protein
MINHSEGAEWVDGPFGCKQDKRYTGSTLQDPKWPRLLHEAIEEDGVNDWKDKPVTHGEVVEYFIWGCVGGAIGIILAIAGC